MSKCAICNQEWSEHVGPEGMQCPDVRESDVSGPSDAAAGSPPVFRWEQCYEMGDGSVHWALCDSATDADSAKEGTGRRVSCGYMVLLADFPEGMDGRPLSEQRLPALIVQLLNEHYVRQANASSASAEQDPFESEEYQKFVASMVPHCHCHERLRPCDGVLAGGLCDGQHDDPREMDDLEHRSNPWGDDEE